MGNEAHRIEAAAQALRDGFAAYKDLYHCLPDGASEAMAAVEAYLATGDSEPLAREAKAATLASLNYCANDHKHHAPSAGLLQAAAQLLEAFREQWLEDMAANATFASRTVAHARYLMGA